MQGQCAPGTLAQTSPPLSSSCYNNRQIINRDPMTHPLCTAGKCEACLALIAEGNGFRKRSLVMSGPDVGRASPAVAPGLAPCEYSNALKRHCMGLGPMACDFRNVLVCGGTARCDPWVWIAL